MAELAAHHPDQPENNQAAATIGRWSAVEAVLIWSGLSAAFWAAMVGIALL
jgi:hypothetical protein